MLDKPLVTLGLAVLVAVTLAVLPDPADSGEPSIPRSGQVTNPRIRLPAAVNKLFKPRPPAIPVAAPAPKGEPKPAGIRLLDLAPVRPEPAIDAGGSAVQRELRKLYRSIGREMPAMDLSALPKTVSEVRQVGSIRHVVVGQRPAGSDVDPAGHSIEPGSSLARTRPNPFTGGTLEPVEKPVVITAPPDPETLAKHRQIAELGPQVGFKGLCPVALRDRRELVTARIEFAAVHEGRTYLCGSAEARERLLANPTAYIPAGDGRDVVLRSEYQRRRPGTPPPQGLLDHAAWYRGRLYLFTSAATRETFRADPERYVAP